VLDDIAQAFGNEFEDYSRAIRALAQYSNQTPIDLHQIKEKISDAGGLRKEEFHVSSCSLSLTNALGRYLEEKRKTWNPKSVIANERNLGLKIETFIQIVGDLECMALTTAHILDYKSKLFKLPANRSKKRAYRGLAIDELFAMDIPDSHLLSAETLSGHLNKVSAFLEWGFRNGLMKADLKLPIQLVIKKPKHASGQRDAFNSNDLRKLFNSAQYLSSTHKYPSHYYVPLLALFTGARQNELCQLYRSDVYQEKATRIWVLDINGDGDDKHLKKPSHARLVPIHPQLVELGFIDYVKAAKTQRLFSDLKFKRDGYGQSFSRWFNETYRNARHCNVGQSPDERKNFHSFRHSFITQLINNHNVPQHKLAHIVGHRPNDGSETIQRYTKPLDLKDRFEIIFKVRWDSIDFKKIQPFKGNFG